MSDQKTIPSARQVVRAAIAAAGKAPVIGQRLGVPPEAIHRWAVAGYVPAEYVRGLCELGCNVVTVEQLLDAMSRAKGAPAVEAAA